MAIQLAMRFSRRMQIGLVTVLGAVLLVIAGDYASREIRIAFNRQNMEDLALNTLARAEIATDYALIRLGELHQEGHTDCSAGAREALDYAVLRSGSIKDILTVQGDVVCSVASNSQTLTENHRDPVDSVAARNPNIVLNPLRMNGTPAMAVTWKFDDQSMATALVNTESLVFDVLSPELRDDSAIKLSLTNGRTVGSFEGANWEIGGDTEMFEVKSQRFPITVRIHIPVALITRLNMEYSILTHPAAIGLALLFAFLAARGVVPPDNASGRIRHALKCGEIVPHFQPIYDLRNGDMTGFEVLARWPKPGKTWVSPTVFVPMIEDNGWSDDLLESMVRQTTEVMAEVIDGAPGTTFGFNISPAQICAPNFGDRVLTILNRAGLAANRVVLEITEREVIGDVAAARANIDRLKATGIRFAIDDTGTGHNGLASIRALGAAILKIDKFFVDGIEHDPRAGTLVRMLVSVAREYHMKIVAEGVEKCAQLETLAELGVDEVQGFFMCRPLDAAEMTLEYARHRAVLLRERIGNGDNDEEDMQDAPKVAVTA